jgi:hypothetical protein
VRVFKTKDFVRFASKENIEDASLCDAIFRAERGVIDADLTGGLIKQRVPRRGQGRSGGFRTIIAYRRADRAFFIYGFAKNAMDNINDDDLKRLKVVAAALLNLSKVGLKTAITEKKVLEVICDGKKI